MNGSPVIAGDVPREQLGELRLRVEPGADRGAALRQRVEILHRHAQPRDAALDLRGIAGEFLAERQRRRILGMGAADLDDLGERLLLLAQRAVQIAERRDQVGGDLRAAAICIAVGNESFDDWLILT